MAAIRNILAGWLLVGPLAFVSWADDDQARLFYSRGVHAYFDGLYPEAKDLLSQSIDKNSSDPRPFYFRGVVNQLMGDTEQAAQDFRAGAELESTPAGRAYDVGDALERIQGPLRMEIESRRRDAFSQASLKRRNQSTVAGGRSISKANAARGAAFDPKNLPDISAIADPSVPFPDTTAKAYFPPVKSAASQQDAIISAALAQPAAAAAAKTPPADDPFSGGNATKKTDQPAPKSNQDDPFGGGGNDQPKEDVPQTKEPPAESNSDDPFSGG